MCIRDSPQCNIPSDEEGEWVINESISFGYPASIGSIKSIIDGSLHMPVHEPSVASTSVEAIEGATLVVPPFKQGQAP